MSWGVKWALRRDVMTPEMALTFLAVMSGSESLNSSFGSRPILCKISALLLSLVWTEVEKKQSVAITGKSLYLSFMQTLSAAFLFSIWNWFYWMFPRLFQLSSSTILITDCCKCWQSGQQNLFWTLHKTLLVTQQSSHVNYLVSLKVKTLFVSSGFTLIRYRNLPWGF